MSQDVTKINAKIGVVVFRVVMHLFDQIPEMLMRVIELIHKQNPADWMLSAIKHAFSPIA